jgi:hypothetical protein
MVRKSPSAYFWLVGLGLWRVPGTRAPRADHSSVLLWFFLLAKEVEDLSGHQ